MSELSASQRLIRIEEIAKPIRDAYYNNPIVNSVCKHYANDQNISKETALYLMVVELAEAIENLNLQLGIRNFRQPPTVKEP